MVYLPSRHVLAPGTFRSPGSASRNVRAEVSGALHADILVQLKLFFADCITGGLSTGYNGELVVGASP